MANAQAARRLPVERLSRVEHETRADCTAEDDWVAIEEPLEIRLGGEPFAVTMRSPGDDLDLTAGFLLTEGVITQAADLERLEASIDALDYDPDNVVDVELTPNARGRQRAIDGARRERLAMAGCGLCGKARLQDIYQRFEKVEGLSIDPELLLDLPVRMARAQPLFARTGGVHAAALFDAHGELLDCREDVGRHNAVDKLIGAALRAGELPWHGKILVVSARAGFEIVQKAMMAQVSALVAVGAASTLAVDAAERGGLTLYSFVRTRRANRHVAAAQ